MNSQQAFGVIERVASHSGRNDKVAILAEHKEDEFFKRVLVYALDPTITYGVKALPETIESPGNTRMFNDATFDLLDKLKSRHLTGDAAIEAIQNELSALEPASELLLRRIILRDFRAGFSESTVNKAIKGLIPEFPYMRCCLPKDAKFDTWDWELGVFSQQKEDGTFTYIDVDANGEVTGRSRQGTPLPLEKFKGLRERLGQVLALNSETSGELLVLIRGEIAPREIGNGIITSVVEGGEFEDDQVPIYVAWDQVPLELVGPGLKYKVEYSVRFERLSSQIEAADDSRILLVPTRIVHSYEEATAHFRELVLQRKEGTVMKEPNAPWVDSTSKFQVKRKITAECDLKIVGFEPGKGKNEATFGSLICETSDETLRVSVSGFKDALRADIHANRDAWLGSIITVKFNTIMYASEEGKKHSLFLPRFAERRIDKTEADSFERVQEQFEAAINEI
ncbi:hypothetical protein [Methylobacillus sp.]|uniref:hypothetical protein n=1 Tax=Methylobacillus sp. TaxID=56818 RepID=UPI0012CE72EB|nr:hypothetical protein [Methylobacillus sp.]MPS48574.1 hypothetical protein [Methylobacillus sp.]